MDSHPAFRPPARDSLGPLFDVAPDIRTPAPSRPTRSSEAAADMITDSPLRRASWRKIMLYLAAQTAPASRETICAAVGIPQHVACARLSELRPMWIATHERACLGSCGVHVDGYSLTDAGRDRVRRATTEPIR